MDNSTILIIVVLACALIYFILKNKPTPTPPVYPCFLNYVAIKGQLLKLTNLMTTFFINFAKKFGTLSKDPLVEILYSLLYKVSSIDPIQLADNHYCNIYADLKLLIKSLLDINDSTLSGHVDSNLVILFDGKHQEDLDIYLSYIEAFKNSLQTIDSEIYHCCGLKF